MTVSATLCFYQYDGPQTQGAIEYQQVKPTKRSDNIMKQEEPKDLQLIAQQDQLRRRLEALVLKGGK